MKKALSRHELIKQIRNINLIDTPLPNYLSHFKNVTVVGVKLINERDIYSDDREKNVARFKRVTDKGVQGIRRSILERGYINSAIPGMVLDRGKGVKGKRYLRINGFHRSLFCEMENIPFFPQIIIQVTGTLDEQQQTIEKIAGRDNSDDSLFRTTSSENDILGQVGRFVKKGWINKNRTSIIKLIEEIDPYRKWKSVQQIASQVEQNVGIVQPYVLYEGTSGKVEINKWQNSCKSIKYKYNLGGKTDKESYDRYRNKYGIKVGQGKDYMARAIDVAILRFLKDGIKTYVIGHVNKPSKKCSIAQQRIKFIKMFEEKLKVYKKWSTHDNGKGGELPIEILGFAPQIHKGKHKEDWSDIIKIKEIK